MDLVTQGTPAGIGADAATIGLLFLRLTLVGLAAHLSLALMRRASAASRHLVSVTALAAMLAVVLATLAPAWPSVRVPVRGLAAAKERALALLARPSGDASPEAGGARGNGGKNATRGEARSRSATPAASASQRFWLSATPPTAGPAPHSIESDSPGAAGREGPTRARNLLRAWPAPLASWPAALGFLWLAGACALTLRHLGARFAAHRIASSSRAVDDARVEDLLARAGARLELAATPTLATSASVSVPIVMGIRAPRLILPVAALAWSDARLLAVFLHELAHVRRRDAAALLVARAATTLAWVHPLAWSLARHARRDCERACDDAVLAAGLRPSDYASELLAIAQGAGRSGREPAGALAVARPSQLEGRLLAILNAAAPRGPASRRVAAVALAAAVAGLISLTSIRVVAAPEPAPTLASAVEKSEPSFEPALEPSSALPVAGAEEGPEPALVSATSRAHELRAKSKAALGSPDDELDRVGAEAYAEAKKLYDEGRFEEAGMLYERAAESGHMDATAWYNAACCYSLAGQENRALGALQHAIESGFTDLGTVQHDDDLAPLRSARRFQLMLRQLEAELESREKDPGERKAIEEVGNAAPGAPEELKSAGFRLMRSGRPGAAATMFARQYAADSLPSSLYNMACAQALDGKADAALVTLERSIYAGYGDGDKLEDDTDLTSLRRRPEFGRLVKLADELSLFSAFPGKQTPARWRAELPRYERTVRAHPETGRAWFNLGFAQLRAGDARGSRESYRRTLQLGYRRASSHYNMACAEAQLGDHDAAIASLARAEAAGMNVEDIAPGDDDLEPLRDDRRFLEMVNRWDRAKRAEHAGKQAYEKAKSGEKDKSYEKEKAKRVARKVG